MTLKEGSWKSRVVVEAKELAVKIDALQGFADNGYGYCDATSPEELQHIGLLDLQLKAMKKYHDLLIRRIKMFDLLGD